MIKLIDDLIEYLSVRGWTIVNVTWVLIIVGIITMLVGLMK